MSELEIWLRNSENIYPRRVTLKRMFVNNDVELIDKVILNNGNFVNIFSEYQRVHNIFDTMFIDIDVHNKNLSFLDRLNLLIHKVDILKDLLEKEDLVGRWYFTGNGFHCYIDFPNLKFKNKKVYSRTVRKLLYEVIEKHLQEDIIDFQVLGDSNRMARFPLTMHPKTNMNMIRTDVESRMNKIIENSAIGKSFGQPIDWKNKNSWLYDYLESLQKEIKIIDNEAKSQIDIELKGLDLPPCILQGINLLILTGELEHYSRVHLGSYLLKVMDIKLIQNIFSFANDYGNGYETMKQLDSLKNYNPYSCKNATFNGICPFGMNYKKCPFYDLSDGWLGRLFIKE